MGLTLQDDHYYWVIERNSRRGIHALDLVKCNFTGSRFIFWFIGSEEEGEVANYQVIEEVIPPNHAKTT